MNFFSSKIRIFHTRLAMTIVSTTALLVDVPSTNCNPLGGCEVTASKQCPKQSTKYT